MVFLVVRRANYVVGNYFIYCLVPFQGYFQGPGSTPKGFIAWHLFTEYHHLRLAIISLLRARVNNFAAHFAIKCSSFCRMNVGTSMRMACCSLGFDGYESVRTANRLLERTG